MIDREELAQIPREELAHTIANAMIKARGTAMEQANSILSAIEYHVRAVESNVIIWDTPQTKNEKPDQRTEHWQYMLAVSTYTSEDKS